MHSPGRHIFLLWPPFFTRKPGRRQEKIRLLLLLLASLQLVPAHAATLPPDLGKRLVTGYIQPATQTFSKSSDELKGSLQAYCSSPDAPGHREAVEKQFRQAVEDWTALEFLRFGPLVEKNRLERIFFFPDTRNVTLRQMQALLNGRDQEALNPSILNTRSVAVQGLPALEFLLYGNGANEQIALDDEAGRYRCSLAHSVSQNIAALASEIAAAWEKDGKMATEFSSPSPTNLLYRNNNEVATEMVKALSTGLQFMRDIKLQPALGNAGEQARGQRAPLWRSGLTQTSLKAGASNLLAFYQAAGLRQRMSVSEQWIDDMMASETRLLLADFNAATLPFEQAVTDTDNREALVHATFVLKNLKAVVDEFLAGSFGINTGFNALDGD